MTIAFTVLFIMPVMSSLITCWLFRKQGHLRKKLENRLWKFGQIQNLKKNKLVIWDP